ncbi:hypothetical protein MJO28_010693 [Puccinia striiformis f. sp. tritici]|uniref:Uncharacterized protein n=1 Tax=Puccinia striiformis f. sp. tritici TaxID=168172 RepID=A0ACC0E5B7_9BASI|nr:hypothetical protein MJO28_010693 [Puccinia striiformis f. sp. tritici]
MTGFNFKPSVSRALCFVLLSVNELPGDLIRLGVVAVQPTPIEHTLSTGPSTIPDLDITRHEVPTPAQSFNTHNHHDEPPDANMRIQEESQPVGLMSPSGHELLKRPSLGESALAGSSDARLERNMASLPDAELRKVTVSPSVGTKNKNSDAIGSSITPDGKIGVSSAGVQGAGVASSGSETIGLPANVAAGVGTSKQIAQYRDSTPGEGPDNIPLTETLSVPVGSGGRDMLYLNHITPDSYDPNYYAGRSFPSSHYEPGEVHQGYPSASNQDYYHHHPVPRQSPSHYQLHYYDYWAPIPAYQLHRSLAYLPVPTDAAPPTNIPPAYEQSFTHAASLQPIHHNNFGESNRNPSTASGRVRNDFSVLGRLHNYKADLGSIPPRFRRGKNGVNQQARAASHPRAQDEVGRTSRFPAEEESEISSLKSFPAESTSTSSDGELSQAYEFPNESENISKHLSPELAHYSGTHDAPSSQQPDEISLAHPHASPHEAEDVFQGRSPSPKHISEPSKEKTKGKEKIIPTSPRLTNLESKGSMPETLHNPSQAFEATSSLPVERAKVPSNQPVPSSQISSSGLNEKPSTSKAKELKGSSKALDSADQYLMISKAKESASSTTGRSESVSAAGDSFDQGVKLGKVGTSEGRERVEPVSDKKTIPPPFVPENQRSNSFKLSAAKTPEVKSAAPRLYVPSSSKDDVTETRPNSKGRDGAREFSRLQQKNRFAILDDLDHTTAHVEQPRSDEPARAEKSPGAEEKSEAEKQLELEKQHAADERPLESKKSETGSMTSNEEMSGSERVTTASKITYNPRRFLESTRPYLESTSNLVSNVWGKVPSLRLPIPTLRFPRFSRKDLLQTVVNPSPSIPLGRPVLDFIVNSKSKFGHMVGRRIGYIKGDESVKPSSSYPEVPPPSLDPEPSKSPLGKPTEVIDVPSNRSLRKGKNFRPAKFMPKELMPNYLKDYLAENSGDKPQEVELLAILGKFLKADSIGSYTPVYLDNKDPDFTAMEAYIYQMHHSEKGGKQWKWLTERIGRFEGRRRWKALLRQYNQTRVLLAWSKLKDTIAKYPYLSRLDEVLRLSENWPTFYNARYTDHAWAKMITKAPSVALLLVEVMGEEELAYRLNNIFIMPRRVYPHNWLNTNDMKTVYQQGLDTSRIVVVGDFLQFGRDHMSLAGKVGIPSYRKVYFLFAAVWNGSGLTAWGTSAEKMWLLSDPERAELYHNRYGYLKYKWKYLKLSPEDFIQTVPEIKQELGLQKDLSKVWWNLSDVIEWREYHMDLLTMAQLGLKLKIPKSRDVQPDMVALHNHLENARNISKDKKQIMEQWFIDNAVSPYDEKPYNNGLNLVPPPSDISTKLSDLRVYLSSAWKQKTWSPTDHPLFLTEFK